MYLDQGRTSSRAADTDSESGHPVDTGVDSDDFLGRPVTVQQEYVYSTEPTAAPPPRVIAGQLPSSGVRAQPSTQARSAVRTFPQSVTCCRSCFVESGVTNQGRGNFKVSGRIDATDWQTHTVGILML